MISFSRSWYSNMALLFRGTISSFLVAAKPFFHMWPQEIYINIVSGSKCITTRWSSWWKSYLISDNNECTFPNQDLIIINQFPDNQSTFSNVAYPIHLRNQIKSNQDPIEIAYVCQLSPCSTYHYANFKCASSAMMLFKIINRCD